MGQAKKSRRPSDEDAGMSRRSMLGLLGLGAIGSVLAACEQGNGALVGSLPDASTGHPLAPSPTPIAYREPPEDYIPPAPVPHKVVASAAPNPAYEKYDIIPRAAWSRSGPDLGRIQPMNGVRLITFHHSGDPKPFWDNTYAGTAQHLEYVREYHRSRNFQDIGYHFGIDRMGRVWQLRSLKYEGQHVRYNNENNIGVVVLGNFDMQPMTPQQQAKVKTFGNLLRRQYALSIRQVKTHREIVSTECPGVHMQPFMVSIRRQGLI